MAEYRQSNGETASWRLKQLYIVDLMVPATWITVVILELMHASKPDFAEGLCLLEQHQLQALLGHGVIHDNLTNRVAVLKFLGLPFHLDCSVEPDMALYSYAPAGYGV